MESGGMLSTSMECLASLIGEQGVLDDRVWTIGELSRECDVTLRALRFYEGKGLLRPMREGTARLYDDIDRRRLKIIVRAKRVGLSLVEIRELLALIFSDEPVVMRLGETLDRLRRQVDQLEAQRRDVDISLSTLREEISVLESRLDR